jgi:O-antigen/teichoic acid export membrane protein
MRRHRALGVVDQAIASLSNVAMVVIAARALSPGDFGGYAVAMAVYAFVAGVARGLVAEPLLVDGFGTSDSRGAEPAGAMTALGVLGGVLCGLGGAVVGGAAGRSLVALAPFLPLLLLQDAWRYVAFTARRPAGALVVDGVWLAVQAGASLWLILGDAGDPAVFVAAWGAAGSVAALTGMARAGIWPNVRRGHHWIRGHRRLGGPFTADFLVAGGASNADLWFLGAVGGLGAAGAFRAAYTLFGPINIVYVGILLTLVPEGARRVREDAAGVRSLMQRASLGLAALAGAWTVALVALPSGAGRAVLGETWPRARGLLLPLGLAMVAGGLAMGATAGLRALGQARATLRARLFALPVVVVLPITGAAVNDELGFTVGFAVATWIGTVLWWAIFLRALAAPPSIPALPAHP